MKVLHAKHQIGYHSHQQYTVIGSYQGLRFTHAVSWLITHISLL